MNPTNIGSVRLVDARTRVVEVAGPVPMGSRHPTDRQLSFQAPRMARPQPVGHCFEGHGRRARFIVDSSSTGDALLALLGRHPRTPVRLASLYGTRAGWWRDNRKKG